MNKNIGKKLICFALAVLVMFALMLYRSANDYDKDFVKLALARGKTVHQVIDLGKEGELKYLLQPNLYTVYYRLQPKDKNAGMYCQSSGFTMMLAQSSKKGVWRELAPKQALRWDKGTLPLSVEMYVPRENVKRYHVGEGALHVYAGDKLYATVLVEMINSRYKE